MAKFERVFRNPKTTPGKLARCALLLFVAAAAATGASAKRAAHTTGAARYKKDWPRGTSDVPASRGVEIVQNGGYPELRVDGAPFFIHSAAFFYDRIPHDLWEKSLDRYRQLTINTIDLYIPWNWHEPQPDQFDFDGHTNPRRDLRGLLRLITDKGFKLIARPGPVILNEWRHGGYPGWLLARPEYKMDLVDRLEGRYPPLAGLNVRDAEAAAHGWLENPTHMAYARQWLEAVARELAPYSSRRSFRVPASLDPSQPKESNQTSGPLLFVQLDDEIATGRTNYAGPNVWRYVNALREMLEAGGLDVALFINPNDVRVSAAVSALKPPIFPMGQWYLQPGAKAHTRERELAAEDLSTLEFYVEELKTQPAFPPILIEYQAGWYCPADDARPEESPVANTLLSSRLLFAHGLHGLNYFPMQDTYFPAGYAVPWANRYYGWDAALDPNANPQPRARAVARNGTLLSQWGTLLAASHKRTDFGLVYPLGAYPQEKLDHEDVLQVSQTVMQIERIAQFAGLSNELLDPEYQPVEQLLRDPLILLPVFDPSHPRFTLSLRAQQVLVDYVRRGGTLVYFPARPAGEVISQLWKDPVASRGAPTSAVAASWGFGKGHVVESSKDFYSWVALSESYAQNRARLEAKWATEALREFLKAAGVQPVRKLAPDARRASDLVVTELVSNEGTGLLGVRSGGEALLSVTNLSSDQPVEESLEVLSPRTSARDQEPSYISLNLSLPPHESLLLPLEHPLCSEMRPRESCGDAVASAGAELLRAQRDGKTLELSFYTPARAVIRLRLAHKPGHISAEDMEPSGIWDGAANELQVVLLRGASPGFRRVLKINLPYQPHVPERHGPPQRTASGYDYTVTNSVRLPLGDGASLLSQPPLLVLDKDHGGRLLLEGHNEGEWGRDINFQIEGAARGSGVLDLRGRSPGLTAIDLRPAVEKSGGPGPDGLLHGTLEIHAGHERLSAPISFALLGSAETIHYQFDFDRDGHPEWVLENAGLRLIISPESGGRALALVEKTTGADLTTSVGALRDNFSFTPNPPQIRPDRARGRYGMFNRPYHAEWARESGAPILRLSYDAPDVYPGGARIEKTVRLVGTDTVQADYHVQLYAQSSTVSLAPPGAPLDEQSFVAVNSVPAALRTGSPTRFCWVVPAAPASTSAKTLPKNSPAQPKEHCEEFQPRRAPLTVPAGVSELDVRTPGRPLLALEWREGQMTIEMKDFSALLELKFPPLVPGRTAGEYQVRYHVPGPSESGQR